MALRVLIVGAGIGGLCLGQGLRKAGIEAQIFERDASAAVRGQGFRFRVDANGDSALEACLPTNLYGLYRATSNRPVAPPQAAYDWQMREVYRIPQRGVGAQHASVNRRTLREVLITGFENSIRFDHALVRVEQSRNGVTAVFANGSTASGDALVAADGIGSVVRRQMLSGAEPLDTGMRCIYGTTPLGGTPSHDALLDRLPEIFNVGFVPFAGPERQTLAMGMFRVRGPFADAVAELAPVARLTTVADYMMWLYVAPLDLFGVNDDDLRAMDCGSLHSLVLELTAEWHPALRDVLERSEVSTLFQIPIRSSPAVPDWASSRVTLLGDAIHAMTPAGGIGANTAMRDAALLAKVLSGANADVVSPIARYEAEMRAYATAAVKQSLEGAAKLYRIPLPETETVR